MQAEKPPNSTLQISSLLFLLFSVKVKVHFTGSESWIGAEHLKGKGTKCTHFIFLFLAADLALPTLCQVEIHQQYNLYGFGFTFFHLNFEIEVAWIAVLVDFFYKEDPAFGRGEERAPPPADDADDAS